jgi:hypothetical protein
MQEQCMVVHGGECPTRKTNARRHVVHAIVGGNNFQKMLIINRLQSKNAWFAPVDFIF